MEKSKAPHVSVMAEEFIQYFADCELKLFFEGTVGAGGHAKRILEAHPEIKKYIGCDRDPLALQIAEKELVPWKKKVELIQADFASIEEILEERGVKSVDGFFLTWGFPQCN
jgi:16S rRNA (cytosine1402-N4)-methyltransferase